MGTMAMAFGASPLIVNPVSPALSSLGVIMGAVWSPPDDGAASAYKIMVAEDGLYRLDAAFFTNNGIDTADINLDTVRLYYMGEEVAVLVNDADSAGVFDASDYIEFYGQPITDQYNKYATDGRSGWNPGSRAFGHRAQCFCAFGRRRVLCGAGPGHKRTGPLVL
jgi:hypothetical protein